jgi:Site-specific DNA methylase
MTEKLKALGAFIFAGSATFGAERAGYQVEKILEMTDDMHLQNAYHFTKNRPDIPVVLPKEWDNVAFLNKEKLKNYDLIYANCPCSSLSQINRNASASLDGTHNIQFHRVYNIIEAVQPKSFVIENAPTLIKLGYPLILDMINHLGKYYKFTIIRDYAGLHNVPMKRMRTLMVGWRKDYFNDKIPLLHMNKKKQMTIKDAIGDLYDVPLGSIPNHELVKHRGWKEYEYLFEYVKENSSIMLTMMEMWDSIKDTVTNESDIKQITRAIAKKSANKNIWDKSPWRSGENSPAPSLTSVTELIHPIHNRQWTIREYARLMGFPDDFIFYPDECETEIIQTLAQGVPASFIEYITSEISSAIKGERKLIDNSENKILNFQHHTKEKYHAYTKEEMYEMTQLEVDKFFEVLEQ